MNIGGAILFSKGFTNKAINQADPVVMSNFGLIMIKWGQRSRINKMTSLGRVPAL